MIEQKYIAIRRCCPECTDTSCEQRRFSHFEAEYVGFMPGWFNPENLQEVKGRTPVIVLKQILARKRAGAIKLVCPTIERE